MSASATREHTKSGCEKDGRFDFAELFDLRGPGEFAEAVAHENCARNFFSIKIAGVWQNGSYAGVDFIAAIDGGLADLDSRHVGDRIQRAGRQHANLKPEI